MKIDILGNRLLVEKVVEDNNSSSGIFLGEAKTRENLGRITIIGDEVSDKIFEVGKLVIYEKGRGTEIQTDSGEQYIIETKDVYGVITEEEIVSENAKWITSEI